MWGLKSDNEKEDLREYKEINDEVIFNKHSLSIKEKFIWTFKLWFGFETKLKVKIKRPITGDEQ